MATPSSSISTVLVSRRITACSHDQILYKSKGEKVNIAWQRSASQSPNTIRLNCSIMCFKYLMIGIERLNAVHARRKWNAFSYSCSDLQGLHPDLTSKSSCKRRLGYVVSVGPTFITDALTALDAHRLSYADLAGSHRHQDLTLLLETALQLWGSLVCSVSYGKNSVGRLY